MCIENWLAMVDEGVWQAINSANISIFWPENIVV